MHPVGAGAAGLVDDELVRRQVLLALSPSGRELLDVLRGQVRAIERLMTAGFDADELGRVRAALESFRTAVEP